MSADHRAAPREWDASSYDRVAGPMTDRGVALLDRLALQGDEAVLDAGCGTGRVTERLLERLPRGRVVALDASERMLGEARARLGRDKRVTFVLADLGRPLPLRGLDAVVSTSTLHWLPDHDAVFGHLAATLEAGGRLLADCGGEGNIAAVLAALADLGEPWHPWTFAGVDATRRRLEAAGFVDADVRLRPEPVPIPPQTMAVYLRAVVLGAHVDRRSPEEAEELVHGVAARLRDGVIDYVRLEISAQLG